MQSRQKIRRPLPRRRQGGAKPGHHRNCQSRYRRDHHALIGKDANEASVYTPHVVVNGREGLIGNSRSQIDAAIARQGAVPGTPSLNLAATTGRIVVGGGPAARCRPSDAAYRQAILVQFGTGGPILNARKL